MTFFCENCGIFFELDLHELSPDKLQIYLDICAQEEKSQEKLFLIQLFIYCVTSCSEKSYIKVLWSVTWYNTYYLFKLLCLDVVSIPHSVCSVWKSMCQGVLFLKKS